MTFTVASHAPVLISNEDERAAFIVKVYQHLALAVGAFVVFETFLFLSGLAQALYNFFARSGGAAWLLLLGGFMVVNWLVSMSVSDLRNPAKQYAGLFAMAGAEGVIFAPFLYYVFNSQGALPVWNAAVVTLVGFGALSIVGYTTRKDLSFIRPIMMWGGISALGLIVAAIAFGFELGIWFSVAMIALAGASILYQTQNIVRRYPEGTHVAASIALFGSLMTMFWYILRIFSRR